jgi:DNA-binding MarR family transcriptional regulator
MGIFDRIQSEVEAREKQEGITLAELLDLSPSLRRLMNRITREGGLTVTAAANTQKMLDRLVEKGYLEREKREEGWVYRTRFARKRGRDMPVGIWSALGERTGERKDSQE